MNIDRLMKIAQLLCSPAKRHRMPDIKLDNVLAFICKYCITFVAASK